MFSVVATVIFTLKLFVTLRLGSRVLSVTGAEQACGTWLDKCTGGAGLACGQLPPAPHGPHAASPPCRPLLCPCSAPSHPPVFMGLSLRCCVLLTQCFQHLETHVLSQGGIMGLVQGLWLWSGPCGVWWKLLQIGDRVCRGHFSHFWLKAVSGPEPGTPGETGEQELVLSSENQGTSGRLQVGDHSGRHGTQNMCER